MILKDLELNSVFGGANELLLKKLKQQLNKVLHIDIRKNSLFENDLEYTSTSLDLKYITIHNTGNYSESATALMHSKYLGNVNDRLVNWHYTVDSSEIYQHFGDFRRCHHTGTNEGNYTSIGIEICVNFGMNEDGTIKHQDGMFRKSCENAALLVAYLATKYDIPVEKIVPHNFWRPTSCPAELMSGTDGVNWTTFINMVKSNLNIDASDNIELKYKEEVEKIMD